MKGLRRFWVRAAFLVSLLVPFYFLFAVLGVRWGMLDWRTGFRTMTVAWGPLVLLAATGFAIVGFFLALVAPPFGRGWRMALAALVIPGAGLGYAYHLRLASVGAPPIHDAATDLVDPPEFSEAVARARAQTPCGNGLALIEARVGEVPDPGCMLGAPGPKVVDLHRRAYPDLQSIELPLPPDRAYAAVLAAARAQKWTIGLDDRDAGRLEATERSFWFGFIDDIAVRVRPVHTGSIVDVRSVSRVGIGDSGANARRIRAFTRSLRDFAGASRSPAPAGEG